MDEANALASLATFKRSDMKYICQYCKKHFVKESSLAVHSCEPRKRHMEKNEPGVRLGFHSYLKFFEFTQGSSKLKTYEEFAESPYYKAFVKFGRYCVDTKVINPARFTEYVVKQNKKLDYWCSDKLYEEYLLWYLKLETMEDALARALEQSIQWGETHNAPAQDYLRYGNHNTIIHAIISGKLSPWVIYNSESGQKFVNNIFESKFFWIYRNTSL